MPFSSPTIVTRSPICNVSDGVATRSTPARLTRVMLMPNELRNSSSPNFLPLSSGFVIRIRREMSFDVFESHWASTVLPMKAITLDASLTVVTTRSSSFRCKIVDALTISCSIPTWCTREMTMLRPSSSASSLMVFPSNASFLTCNESEIAEFSLSLVDAWAFSSSSFGLTLKI